MKNYVQENKIIIEQLPKINITDSSSSCLYGLVNSFLTKYNTSSNTSDINDTSLSILEHYYNRNKGGKFLSYLNDNLNIETINTMTNMTYKATFELIWSILYFKYKQKIINLDDVFERITTEITDSVGLCFTGKYNRLINSMVGIIEGVQVGFSKNEELQLEFGKIIAKLNSKEYTFEDTYCQAKSILEFVEKGIKENHPSELYRCDSGILIRK